MPSMTGIGYSKHQKQPRQKAASRRDLMARFSDMERLKELTLTYLQKVGRSGAFIVEINDYVAEKILQDAALAENALREKKIRDQLSKAWRWRMCR